jgi:two-component system chemotaxis response regulator CheY
MKFLVVDASVIMRRILVNSLQRLGFNEFVEAENGLQALEKFDASIAFVITGWNMPTMSGVELTRVLRAHAPGKTVPILMVTTRNGRDDIVTAVDAGVNDYIVKPFTLQLLKEKIDHVMASTVAPTR